MLDTNKVLNYWFGSLNNNSELGMNVNECVKWHSKSPEVDTEITEIFLADYQKYLQIFKPNLEKAEDYLAYILLFDQFPRNIYRNSKKMYDSDKIALNLTHIAIDKKLDMELTLIQRLFLYMPLMHSESFNNQELMLQKFKALSVDAKEDAPKGEEFFKMAYNYFAVQHHSIVSRFGRFPHRNEILARQSTEEEINFLKENNSKF